MAEKIGNWTLTDEYIRKNGKKMILCKCGCGTERYICAYKLKKGQTKSCGCQAGQRKSVSKTKHGMSHTRIHGIWLQMRRRCKPEYKERKYYFDKGIEVCKEWQVFENFYKWSCENGYSDELTLDRIDNSKGYCPENCRWETKLTQSNNRGCNITTQLDGNRVTAAELGKILNVSRYVCAKRIKQGMNGNQIRKEILNGRRIADCV